MSGLASVPVSKKDKKRREFLERLWKREDESRKKAAALPTETHKMVCGVSNCIYTSLDGYNTHGLCFLSRALLCSPATTTVQEQMPRRRI